MYLYGVKNIAELDRIAAITNREYGYGDNIIIKSSRHNPKRLSKKAVEILKLGNVVYARYKNKPHVVFLNGKVNPNPFIRGQFYEAYPNYVVWVYDNPDNLPLDKYSSWKFRRIIRRNATGAHGVLDALIMNQTAACIQFTITVKSSRGKGGKISPSGRRVAAACWHAHRDFMKVLFALYPNAILQTMLATYRGVSDFEENFPSTGNINVGSRMYPSYYKDCCECEYM